MHIDSFKAPRATSPLNESSPLTPYQPSDAPNLQERVSSCAQDCFQNFVELTRKYSTVVVGLTLFVANIIFLVAKIKDDEATAAKLYLLLNWIGVLYFPYQIHEAIKYGKDIGFAYRMDTHKFTALSALRAANTINNILLTGAGCAASVAQVLKHDGVMLRIFKLTIPWGEVGLICALAIRFFTAIADKTTLNRLEETYEDEELNYVSELLLDHCYLDEPEEDTHFLSELQELAVRIRVCMDKDTLVTFLRTLEKFKDTENLGTDTRSQTIRKIFTTAQKNIKVQIALTQGMKLAVSFINYGLLAASKAHPNSITSASCDLGGQVLYTSDILIEKCLEAKNRRELNDLKIENHENRQVTDH